MKFDCPLKEQLVSCKNCRVAEEETFRCFCRTALTTASELIRQVEQKTIEQFEKKEL